MAAMCVALGEERGSQGGEGREGREGGRPSQAARE